MLHMVFHFLLYLSDNSLLPALTLLLSGGLLELTMAHMVNAGADEVTCAGGLFSFFLKHPSGQEGMCMEAMLDQIMQWIVRWLVEVRDMVAQQMTEIA
jgi:hypothetical protein